MDDDADGGIFLFKDSKAKVTEVIEPVNVPSIVVVSDGSREEWLKKLRFPFLGEAVAVVSAEQLLRESQVTAPSLADSAALTKEQLLQLKRRRCTKSNRRHKKRTRRQRLAKQQSKSK